MAPLGAGAQLYPVTDPLVGRFPGLAVGGYRVTSPDSYQYNCIAWAASRDDRWWWPHQDAFWPPGVPLVVTLQAFEAVYNAIGYTRCADQVFDVRFEKIAIFANVQDTPTHAARQLESGRWTSKLGPWIDIDHATPDALNGQDYGRPVLFMSRSRPLWRWTIALLKRAFGLLHERLRQMFA